MSTYMLPTPSLFLMLPRPPISPLFPYTTLFRSDSVSSTAATLSVSSTGQRILKRKRPWMSPSSLTRTPQKDRKSTRLNSSHQIISYAVFCLKKKKKNKKKQSNRHETTNDTEYYR